MARKNPQRLGTALLFATLAFGLLLCRAPCRAQSGSIPDTAAIAPATVPLPVAPAHRLSDTANDSTASGDSDWPGVPHFPLPPRKPWTLDAIPLEDIAPARHAVSFEAVANKLNRALSDAGYHDYSFLPTQSGFVIVTRPEHIDEDGTPDTDTRFGVDLNRYTPPHHSLLGRIFKPLFTPDPSYYRVIVFMVTPVNVMMSSPEPTAEEVAHWIGFARLPSTLHNSTFDPDKGYQCLALIYGFTNDQYVATATPLKIGSPIAVRDHLDKAGIWAALSH